MGGGRKQMQNSKILIIEDDADIREGVRILLESENYQVTEADNGSRGLELLTEDTDLVILDIMMPGMSGLRTCEEIRKRSNVPVLFLTAKSQESDKLIGLMAGGDDYQALFLRGTAWKGEGPAAPVSGVPGKDGKAGGRNREISGAFRNPDQ